MYLLQQRKNQHEDTGPGERDQQRAVSGEASGPGQLRRRLVPVSCTRKRLALLLSWVRAWVGVLPFWTHRKGWILGLEWRWIESYSLGVQIPSTRREAKRGFDGAGIISSKGIKANIPLDTHSKSRCTADVTASPEVHVLHLFILLTSPFPKIIPDFSYQSFKVPEFNSLFHSILQEFTLKTHLTFTSAALKEVTPA